MTSANALQLDNQLRFGNQLRFDPFSEDQLRFTDEQLHPDTTTANDLTYQDHHHQARLAVALAAAALAGIGLKWLRVAQDHNNPTLFSSQSDNTFDHFLHYSGKYRAAIVAETGKAVGNLLGGWLGSTAAWGVDAALDSISGRATDPNTYAGLRGRTKVPRRTARKELADSSKLISSRWAKQYARQLGEGLGGPSADGLFVSMATLSRQQLPERIMWQVLHSAAGLPQGQAQSVTQVAINRLHAFMGTRRPITAVDLAQDMGRIYLGRRAARVLANEDVVAQNFGRQILFMNAVAKGYLPPDTQKVWLTAVDERVCPVCAPMDSVAVNIDEPFLVRSHSGVLHRDTKLWVPPAHTNCRCTVMARPSVERGMITRTARFSRDNPTASEWPIPARFDQSRARLRSNMGDIVEQNTTPPWMEG